MLSKQILISIKYFFINIYWILFYFKELKLLMYKNNIHNLEIYKFFSWTPSSLFFTGTTDNRKLFIKLYRIKGKLRESIIQQYLSNLGLKWIPRIFLLKEQHDEPIVLLEKIDAEVFTARLKEIEFDVLNNIITQFIDILNEFDKYKVVHCDIKPDNILIDKNNKIYIIDFEYAICKKLNGYMDLKGIDKCVLKNLGANYSMKCFVWDDAYSFNMILNEIIFLNRYTKSELSIILENQTQLKQLIGRNIYEY